MTWSFLLPSQLHLSSELKWSQGRRPLTSSFTLQMRAARKNQESSPSATLEIWISSFHDWEQSAKVMGEKEALFLCRVMYLASLNFYLLLSNEISTVLSHLQIRKQSLSNGTDMKTHLWNNSVYLVSKPSLSLVDTLQGQPVCLPQLCIHKAAPCPQHPLAWHGSSTWWPFRFFLLDILTKALGMAANFVLLGFHWDKCYLSLLK